MRGLAVIRGCAFATAPGAPERFWCGPEDRDPFVFRIGAVRLSLDPPFDPLALAVAVQGT